MNLLTLHKISVQLFLLIYLVKTILLLFNKTQALGKFTKITKIPEMIVSVLFLVTGVWMFIEIGAIKNLQIIKLVTVFAAIPIAIIGFKKQNKILASLSLTLIIVAYGLAEMSRKQSYSVPESATPLLKKSKSSLELGEQLYKANCVVCHGQDGAKGAMGASNLKTSQMNKEQMIHIITEGKNNMMPYKDVLSKEEIAAVAEYTHSLKH